MAFDEDVPQPHLGKIQWSIAALLLTVMAGVIYQQLQGAAVLTRRTSCLLRQKTIDDCVKLWENTHTRLPHDSGFACFTQKSGRIFKSGGLPKGLEGDALGNCGKLSPWVCPERLEKEFKEKPENIPDDESPGGYGNYCFIFVDKMSAFDAPLKELSGLLPPYRSALCCVFGTKISPAPEGVRKLKHNEGW